MRILNISLDRRVLDPSTVVAQRQVEYFRGHEVSFIVLENPKKSKLSIFLSAWTEARRARGFDLVTTQDPFFCGWIGRLAARRMKVPLHVQDHSGAFAREPFGWKERVLYPMARSIVKHAQRIRTVSQRGKRGLMALGISESKIDVIPIATDVVSFSRVDRSRSLPNEILSIMRLEQEKGVDVLLRAFVDVQKARPQTSLVIVGDGSLRKAYERMARRLGIGASVLFVGNESDVKPFLARAGVYVQPSRFEGWGLAVIEAAAAGMPIVMSDAGCAGEVIRDGESGLVVPPGNPKVLATALLKTLSDASLAQVLGNAAKRTVANLPDMKTTAALIRASLEAARLTG